MKIRRFVAASVALAGVVAVPSASGAPDTGQLDVRSKNVDYETGESIDWIVDWTENAPASTTPEDVVVSLGGPHELVAGSVDVPRGWSVTYSDDGRDYSDDAPSKVTHLKFVRSATTTFPAAVASVARSGDILVRNLVPRPLPAITTARSGGDGYIPMLAGDRIYAVWHHLRAGATPEPNIVCIDTLTGKSCPNYPKVLGWQTSYNQGQGIFINNRIYIKNRDATTHGVLCWSTITEQSCGYTPVAALGPVTGTAGGDGGWDQFSSPVLHDGRLYFAGHNFRVYCFDPATSAACVGYGTAGRATARFGEVHATTRRINDVMYHEGRMIFSLATSWSDSPIPLGTKDTCFDLVAGAPCADWGVNGVVTENSGTAYMFPRLDAAGTVVGFCHGVRSGAGEVPLEATIPCHDLNGKNRTTIPAVQPFGQFRPYNVEEATVGTRTFFGRYSTFGAYCYDWSTGAPCTGQYFDANGRSTQSLDEHFYGFVRRGECMVGLGHKGVLMSVDPVTGASPCRKLVDSNFVTSASSRYCADTKYLTGWRLGLASDVPAADFDRLDVTVTDGTTTVTGDIRATSLALEGLAADKNLTVNVNGTVKTTADPWATGTPALNFLYSGSSQFCFRTVAEKASVPIRIEAKTDVDTDVEVVPVDPTPEGTGGTDETAADDDEGDAGGADGEQSETPAGDSAAVGSGRLSAVGADTSVLAGWSLALMVAGAAVVVLGRRSRGGIRRRP